MSFVGVDGMAAATDNLSRQGNSAQTLQLMEGEDSPRPVRAGPIRFVILVVAACFMFGTYYFYDQTSATRDDIIEQTGMSNVTFGVLSSVYSMPNVVLPLFGGFFVDRFGIPFTCVGFAAFVSCGSSIFTLGLQQKKTWMLILGRLVFGMGGESQNVTNMALVSKWFRGKELAFALGITVTVSRLGSVATFNTQPLLVKSLGVIGASFVGTCVCLCSFCFAMGAALIDKTADKRDARLGVQAEVSTDKVSLTQVKDFGKMFYIVSLSCVVIYSSVFPFLQVTSMPFLQEKYGFSQAQADTLASLPNLISAIFSPICGIVIDKLGIRPLLIMIASGVFIACDLLLIILAQGEQNQMFATILYGVLGVALAIYGTVIWPCIPLTVPAQSVGTAFGLTTAFQNGGMAATPILLAWLHDSSSSFTPPFIYLIVCCSIGLATGFILLALDRERVLSKP